MYRVYWDYKDENKDIQVLLSHRDELTGVMGDFEIIGLLVKSNNIDELFLEEYGATAYQCWECVSKYVTHEREIRKRIEYMENFQWLAEQAKIKDPSLIAEPYDDRSSPIGELVSEGFEARLRKLETAVFGKS